MQLYIKPEKAGHLMYIFIDPENDFTRQIIQGQLSTIAPEVLNFSCQIPNVTTPSFTLLVCTRGKHHKRSCNIYSTHKQTRTFGHLVFGWGWESFREPKHSLPSYEENTFLTECRPIFLYEACPAFLSIHLYHKSTSTHLCTNLTRT